VLHDSAWGRVGGRSIRRRDHFCRTIQSVDFTGINLLESTNWIWGLSLIVLTLVIHATGVAGMALAMQSIRIRLERRNPGLRDVFAILIGSIGALGMLLIVLLGIESAVWAAAYLWLGALDSPEDAILYSVDSMTTRGASGLILQHHWLMMGALEAADGMLLFGISTAFMFAVLQVFWPMFSKPLLACRNLR
jgi:hypothetical protein